MSDDVPVNAADLKRAKSMIVEMTVCLQKIDDQREAMKDVAETIEDKTGIKKKMSNKIARTMFQHSYHDLQSENEHFEFLYEAIAEGKNVQS